MEEVFSIGLLGFVVVIIVGFVLLHVMPPHDACPHLRVANGRCEDCGKNLLVVSEPTCAHCEALAIGGDGRTAGPRVISSEVVNE